MKKPLLNAISSSVAYLAAAALLIAVTTGCSGNIATGSDDTISFKHLQVHKAYTLENSAKDYSTKADLTFGTVADMLLPTTLYSNDVAALRESIMKVAFDTTGTDMPKVIDSYFVKAASDAGYRAKETATTDTTALYDYDGFVYVEGNVVALTPTVLSYAVTVSNYEPRAAHGMYTTEYINYDLATGKTFTLADLFTPKGLEELPARLRQIAASLETTLGPTDITALPAGDNFYLTTSGKIVFAYQPYEIASYAQGEVRVPVAGYTLADILTPLGHRILVE